MQRAAAKLDFETAADLRDEINALKELLLRYGKYDGGEGEPITLEF